MAMLLLGAKSEHIWMNVTVSANIWLENRIHKLRVHPISVN